MLVDRPEDTVDFDLGNREPMFKGEDGAIAGSPEGDADLAPAPSWSSFERLRVMMTSCWTRSTLSQLRPTTSGLDLHFSRAGKRRCRGLRYVVGRAG
jgi:hypothetical protein